MNSLVIAERDADNFEVVFVGNLADGEFCIFCWQIFRKRRSFAVITMWYLNKRVERTEKPPLTGGGCDNSKRFRAHSLRMRCHFATCFCYSLDGENLKLICRLIR